MSGASRYNDVFDQLERMMMADPVEAASHARKSLSEIDSQGTVSDQLHIRRMLVMALAHASQFQDSLNVAEDALKLENGSDAPEDLARIRLASMQPLAHLGRIEDSMRAGEQARSELEQLGSEVLAGRASLNLGSIQAMTGRHQESLDSFDRALSLLKDDAFLSGQIQTNRGSALSALDKFEDAEEAFSVAGKILGDQLPWAAAVVEGNLADLAARQGALHQSLRHFEASRRYLEQEDSLGDVGRLDAEEATVLSMLGMTSLATELFTRAGTLLKEHGTPADLAMARLGFGRALADAGELSKAEEMLQTIESSLDSEEHPDLYRQYLGLSAHIAIEKADWDAAESIIDIGLGHVSDRPIQRATWLMLQARVAEARSDIDSAQELLSIALALAESAHISPLVASIKERLSTVARQLDQDDTADTFAREAIAGYEAIRGNIQADQMRKVWHQGRLGIYGDYAISLMQRDDSAAQSEAFELVERIRSRSLLDVIQQGGADFDDDIPLSDDEKPLLEALNRHRRWLNWTYSSLARGQELSDDQQSELAEHERTAKRLEDRLAMLRPAMGFYTPISLESVQDKLSDEAVLLSYLVIGDQVMIQVIDKQSVYGNYALVTNQRLSELVSEMQFQVGRELVSGTAGVSARREARLKRDMDQVLEQLYDALIQPVENLIAPKKHCIVIPSGDLHSVPFAALRRNGEYLSDTIAFTTAPGVSVLAGMAGRGHSESFSPTDPLVVGVSDDNAPGLSEEAELLAAGMNQPNVLLNDRARKEAVTTAMQQADLVHLACHGRFDPAYPEASGLQLADGWLTLDDVRRIRLDNPLMVLSGCETGRARVDQGDDLVGLMTAMIASGAGELVTSLWKTHDHAALSLMQAFYSALEQGESVTSALRFSQSEVRKQFPHPAMWAPFVSISRKSREVLA